MFRFIKDPADFPANPLRHHPDSRNQLPGQRLFNQELRLFVFLAIAPLRRLDRIPIDLVQLIQIAEVIEESRTGIRIGERPSPAFAIGPLNDPSQVGYQVYDRLLPVPINQFRVIGTMNHEEHHRSRAEVEWDTVPNVQIRVTAQGKLQPPLDFVHADFSTRQVALKNLGITPELPGLNDRMQPVHMNDVADARVFLGGFDIRCNKRIDRTVFSILILVSTGPWDADEVARVNDGKDGRYGSAERSQAAALILVSTSVRLESGRVAQPIS